MSQSELPAGHLFHYTSAAGFSGILSSRELWATVVHFMNDTKEFEYTLDLLRELLHERARSRDEDEAWAVSVVLEHLDSIRFGNVCAFSLSEDGDLLSQWRAYAPPEGGYAIGFHPSGLREAAAEAGFHLTPCVYEPERQRAQLVGLLSALLPALVDSRGSATPLQPINQASAQFNRLAATFKHPSFREEREWRLVSKNPIASYADRFDFHQTPGLLIPHFRIALGSLRNVAMVRVGPHAHQVVAEKSTRAFIFKLGAQHHIALEASDIPYRARW